MLEIFNTEKLIIVLNKSDIADGVEIEIPDEIPSVSISALTGDGIDELKGIMTDQLGIKDDFQTHPVITQRHLEELRSTDSALNEALQALEPAICDIVIAAGSLREGSEALGRITGNIYSDDLLDNIFSKFCVGK
jgi:tRNA modification GTPase